MTRSHPVQLTRVVIGRQSPPVLDDALLMVIGIMILMLAYAALWLTLGATALAQIRMQGRG